VPNLVQIGQAQQAPRERSPDAAWYASRVR
jgi:hypothetical protein